MTLADALSRHHLNEHFRQTISKHTDDSDCEEIHISDEHFNLSHML